MPDSNKKRGFLGIQYTWSPNKIVLNVDEFWKKLQRTLFSAGIRNRFSLDIGSSRIRSPEFQDSDAYVRQNVSMDHFWGFFSQRYFPISIRDFNKIFLIHGLIHKLLFFSSKICFTLKVKFFSEFWVAFDEINAS